LTGFNKRKTAKRLQLSPLIENLSVLKFVRNLLSIYEYSTCYWCQLLLFQYF